MVAQKITIEPVTRIEGHAKVTVHLKEDGSVDHARLHVNEFRGFEKFCEGRLVKEMPSITPRICGICPVSHHLAAAKAGDSLYNCPPPRPALLLRDLMHMGQITQSHGMHFFELAGPDLLLGFDSDPAIRNVIGLSQVNPDLTVKAVKLRQFGQDIIKILGGRKIHPDFAIPGGVNKTLSLTERDSILSRIDDHLATAQLGVQIIRDWAEKNSEDIQKFAVLTSGYLGLVNPENGLELTHGQIRLIGSDGNELELFDGKDYLNYIAEHVENWSYLKFPYYKKLGWPQGAYRVGPLGRLNTANTIETPIAGEYMKYWKSLNQGKPVENTLYYHLARMIETVYAIERIKILCEHPDITSNEILNTRIINQGEGVGIIEAPRGTLIHHYWAKENDQLTKVNLIVATGHNNWAMSTAVDSVAKTYIQSPVTEGMLNRVEAAIRAHDPCLSCSTHAIGQMPIVLDVFDHSGAHIQTLKR